MVNDQKKIKNGIINDPEFYHTLLDSITDGVFVLNRDWEYIIVNQKAAELVKMTIEQLLNNKITTLFPGIEQTQFFRLYEQVMKERKNERIVAEFVHPDGRKGYYEVSVYPVPEGILCISRDITESKTIEEELIEEKLFTETALNSQQDTFFIFEISTGKTLRWNKAFREISGYSDREISTMKAPDSYYSEEDLKKAEMTIGLALNEGVANVEISLITKSGKKIPFEYYTSIMKDSEGNPRYMISIGRDITERKKVEEVLYLERDLIRTLLDNHPDFIYFKDIEGRFLHISKRFSEFFGRSKEDIIGKTDLDLFPEEIAKQSYSEDLHVIKTGTPLINKEENAAGTWVLTTKIPWFDKYGNKKGLFGISHDITERKKAEEEIKESDERLKKFMEAAPNIFMLYDSDLNLININNIGIKRFPAGTKKEDIIGKNIVELSPDIKKKGRYDEYLEVIKTGKPFYVEEFIPHPKFGNLHISLSAFKVLNGLGIIARDITETKKSEEELKKSEENYRKAFERAELYKDLFAHDISNMLQNIRSSVDLFSVLRNRPEELEKLDDIMEIINDQIIRGSKLVSNIRKLSEVSESESILEIVNINTVLKEAVNFINECYLNKNLNIIIESKFEDMVVKANTLLLDVFENILFNAVKYTENPVIDILIRMSKELKNDSKYVKIEFLDNGIGISDNMKKTIFKGMSTHKKRIKGMGLGLLLVKRILDRYKAEIWVEDKIKGDQFQGSNFIVLIPEEVD